MESLVGFSSIGLDFRRGQGDPRGNISQKQIL